MKWWDRDEVEGAEVGSYDLDAGSAIIAMREACVKVDLRSGEVLEEY